MEVLLFAAIREAAGAARVHTDVATVADLAEELAGRYGEVMRTRLRTASVMVDGRKVPIDDRTVRLADAAEVAVVPPFAGG